MTHDHGQRPTSSYLTIRRRGGSGTIIRDFVFEGPVQVGNRLLVAEERVVVTSVTYGTGTVYVEATEESWLELLVTLPPYISA
jgi:hypothetical protein